MADPPITEPGANSGDTPAPPARLVVVHGSSANMHVDLQSMTSIGRADDNELVLDSVHVSRHHARLMRRDSQYHIEDLNSRNGVIVNGRSLARGQSFAVSHGDTIRIGDQLLVFLDAAAQESARRLSTIHIDRNRVRREADNVLGEPSARKR